MILSLLDVVGLGGPFLRLSELSCVVSFDLIAKCLETPFLSPACRGHSASSQINHWTSLVVPRQSMEHTIVQFGLGAARWPSGANPSSKASLLPAKPHQQSLPPFLSPFHELMSPLEVYQSFDCN